MRTFRIGPFFFCSKQLLSFFIAIPLIKFLLKTDVSVMTCTGSVLNPWSQHVYTQIHHIIVLSVNKVHSKENRAIELCILFPACWMFLLHRHNYDRSFAQSKQLFFKLLRICRAIIQRCCSSSSLKYKQNIYIWMCKKVHWRGFNVCMCVHLY